MPPNKKTTEQLLKETIKQNKKIIKEVENLKKLFIRNQIMSYVRTIIIITPIVIAILYLIPVVSDFLKVYQPLIEYFDKAKDLKNLIQ